MQIKWLRFIPFILIIIISEQFINNFTHFYVDCLGFVLIIILINNTFTSNATLIITLSFIADLIGHWYLGTHLLAITLVSFITKYMLNFYRMSASIQKTILCGFLYSIFILIITIIDILTNNNLFLWKNLLLEILVINPIILIIFNNFVIQFPSDIIRLDR